MKKERNQKLKHVRALKKRVLCSFERNVERANFINAEERCILKRSCKKNRGGMPFYREMLRLLEEQIHLSAGITDGEAGFFTLNHSDHVWILPFFQEMIRRIKAFQRSHIEGAVIAAHLTAFVATKIREQYENKMFAKEIA